MSKSFCVLPFVHLATHPSGQVSPCCDNLLSPTDEDGNVMNLNTHTIDQIRNSKSFKELRDSMINGEQHPSCKFCWDMEEKNLESRRIGENKNYAINDITKNYYINNFNLFNVELRLGNICNSKCLICHPHSSSKWNEDSSAIKNSEFAKLYKDIDLYDKKVIEKEWYRSDSFYNQLIDDYPKLNYLWFNGGEPTLIKEHFSFLEKLIDSGKSKKMTLNYNINGISLPDRLIKIWKEFMFVQVTVSLDDIHDRLYYQRYPAKFDNVMSTIKKLETNNIIYTLIPTVSLYNVYNIHNVLDYFYKNTNGNEPGLNFVYHPPHLVISNLPQNQKDKLIKLWKSSSLPNHVVELLIFEISKKEKLNINLFKKFTQALDLKRNLNVLDYLPEYDWLFGGENLI